MFCAYKADIEVSMTELFSILKIMPGTSVYSYSADRFESLLAEVRESAEITAGYVEIDHVIKTGQKDIDTADRMIVCVCSCSNRNSEAAAELIRRGSYLDGYIADGAIDAAIFNASRRMNDSIRAGAESRGLFLTDPLFPGEREASMDLLIPFLDTVKRHADIDLALTDGMMLIPEKSLLYAFGVRSEECSHDASSRCDECGMMSCEFRSAS